MKLVVLGLSLSSSWGNGHATTYRSLLKAFAARGHDILFLERDVPWYSGPARDLAEPGFCDLRFYKDLAELQNHYAAAVAAADAVIVGSYVPDGQAVGDWVQATARGVRAFYDIDTPVTVAALENGSCAYLRPDQIPGYDSYLSFTGGPILDRLQNELGSPDPRALYCCVDPEIYRPTGYAERWHLSYLGTYSPDRQPTLDRLLLEPARRRPDLRFVVAGSMFPPEIEWPANVERFEHVGPQDHPEFYGSSRWTLNVTRADMIRAGYSPSVRLFEAAACGTPIVSDRWDGIETVLTPGQGVVLADDADTVLATIDGDPGRAARIAADGRKAVLDRHTSAHRAAELEAALTSDARAGRPPVDGQPIVRVCDKR